MLGMSAISWEFNTVRSWISLLHFLLGNGRALLQRYIIVHVLPDVGAKTCLE